MNRLILIFFISLLCYQSKAQYGLSFGSINPIVEDTSEIGSFLGLEFYIINTGLDTIFWEVSVNYGINLNTSIDTELFYSENLVTFIFDEYAPFLPGDSIYFSSAECNDFPGDGYIEVSPERNFSLGDNIIVVWPSIYSTNLEGSTLTIEQFIKKVYIFPTSIVDEYEQIEFKIFTNNNSLNVISEKTIGSMTLYDTTGKLIQKTNKSKIKTNTYTPGIYFLQISFLSGDIRSAAVLIH